MSTTAEGLGFIYDIGTCWSPVDLNTANGATGKRISLLPGRGVDIVVFKAAGTAADDFAYTLREHTAYTSGTSADLVKIDHYYLKSETALDNDEGWSILEQTASATITEAGAAGTSAEHEQMIVIPVYASQLTEGYTHVSLNAAATVGNAQLAAAFYIVHGLRYRRRPDRLFNLLRPGVANA
jgi:hypothetical protein